MSPVAVLLIVVLVVLALGGPWVYRQAWYAPAYGYGGGFLGLVLVVVLILLLAGWW